MKNRVEGHGEHQVRYISVPIVVAVDDSVLLGVQARFRGDPGKLIESVSSLVSRTNGTLRVLQVQSDNNKGSLVCVIGLPRQIGREALLKELKGELVKTGAESVEEFLYLDKLVSPRSIELVSGYSENVFTMDEEDLVELCRIFKERFGLSLASFVIKLIGDAWGRAAFRKLVKLTGGRALKKEDLLCLLCGLSMMKGMGIVTNLEMEENLITLVTRENKLYATAIKRGNQHETMKLASSLVEGYLQGFFSEALKIDVEVLEIRSEAKGHRENVYYIKKRKPVLGERESF